MSYKKTSDLRSSEDSRLKLAERIASIVASIAVIVGIPIALVQLYQTDKFQKETITLAGITEKRRIAIEAVDRTRSTEFLKAYRILKVTYHTRYAEPVKKRSLEEDQALIDSLNYVMNTYDSIAIMYINNLADRCIIKDSIYSGSKEIATFCDSFLYPEEERKNFNNLLALMEREKCEQEDRNSQTR